MVYTGGIVEFVRIGVALSKEGQLKLGELATQCEIAQSALVETLIWLVADDKELTGRVRALIKEKAEVEDQIRERLRHAKPGEAKKLLAKLDR